MKRRVFAYTTLIIATLFLWVLFVNRDTQTILFPFTLLLLPHDGYFDASYALSLQTLLFALLITYCTARLARLSKAEIGWTRPSRTLFIKWLQIALYPATFLLVLDLIIGLGGLRLPAGFMTHELFVTLPSAITEEIFVRGVLLGILLRLTSEKRALLSQALVFGLMHWITYPHQPFTWLAIAALGYLFGLARLRSGSIATSSVAHAIHNMVVEFSQVMLL